MSMKFIGSVIDSMFDFFSPDKIAVLVSRRVKPPTAKRMYAGSKMVSGVLLILCLVALVLNMADYGPWGVYKGYQLIKETVPEMTMVIKYQMLLYDIGLYVLSMTSDIISVIALAAIVILFVRKFPFRNICWMTGLNVVFVLAVVAYCQLGGRVNAGILYYSTRAIYLKPGFYILTGLHIISFCLAIFGRACEKTLGLEASCGDYRYRQGPIAKPAIVAACLVLTVPFFWVLATSGEEKAPMPLPLKIVLIFGIMLLIVTVFRSEYAGVMAWVSLAHSLVWSLVMWCIASDDFSELGFQDWMSLLVLLLHLVLSVFLVILLNRRVSAYSGRPLSFTSTYEARQEESMGLFCAECGTPLGPEDDFCPNCGTRR